VAMQILWGFADLRPLYVTQIVLPIARLAVLGVGAWRWGIAGILGGQVVFYVAVAAFVVGYVLVLAFHRRRSSKSTMA
jgi:F0F1-type ATP synthase assembly protein I